MFVMTTTHEAVKQLPRVNDPAPPGSQESRIANSMLREFERELDTTRRFIGRLPEDRLTWRPHEKSMTAGQLALHLAEVPGAVLKLSMPDEATAPDFTAPRRQPAGLAEVYTVLESGAEYVRKVLPTIDDERMSKKFTVLQNERTLAALPRADFLRAIMLNQCYHHRGQLGVYLRLLGAVVPSSYGPSGDEMPRFSGD
jgi:uncharacterized damage-inducible protein DinB